jgi:hypothetical protein
MRSSCAVLLLTILAAPVAGSQTPSGKEPPYPKTGVDYSGIDQFYVIADILARNVEPSEAQWRTLMATPGYRLVEIDNEGIRGRIELALKPSLKAKRDSVLALDNGRSRVLQHLIRAAGDRAGVMTTRAALEHSISDSIAAAAKRTARFLPAGTIERLPTPFIGFAVFADDGYTEDPGILLDPLYVQETGLVDLLAHEFHHAYTAMINHVMKREDLEALPTMPADIQLFLSVMHLRNEGIADQVDKTYPLPVDPKQAYYATGYNAAYAKTPQVLRSVDSVLAIVADRPTQAGAGARKLNALLVSNGHPNGAYMAREIVETFGIDSLMPGVYNPIAFFRTYAAAEAKRGNPPPFSPKATSELGTLEKHFITR